MCESPQLLSPLSCLIDRPSCDGIVTGIQIRVSADDSCIFRIPYGAIHAAGFL